MTGSAKDQCLSFSCGHDFDPAWLLPTVIDLQIFECSQVMHFYLISETCGFTHFTYLCQESLFQFGSSAPFPSRLVLQVCLHIPGECDSAPGRYQWFLPFTVDRYLKDLVSLPFHLDFRLVLLVDFPYRGFVLVRKRLCQRLLHDPFQATKGMKIVGHAVIFHDSSVFELIRCDDSKL